MLTKKWFFISKRTYDWGSSFEIYLCNSEEQAKENEKRATCFWRVIPGANNLFEKVTGLRGMIHPHKENFDIAFRGSLCRGATTLETDYGKGKIVFCPAMKKIDRYCFGPEIQSGAE